MCGVEAIFLALLAATMRGIVLGVIHFSTSCCAFEPSGTEDFFFSFLITLGLEMSDTQVRGR